MLTIYLYYAILYMQSSLVRVIKRLVHGRQGHQDQMAQPRRETAGTLRGENGVRVLHRRPVLDDRTGS